MTIDTLPRMQRQVAQLALDGLNGPEIAKQLTISPHTARNHLKAVYAKYGVRSRSQLVAAILRPSNGEVPKPGDLRSCPTCKRGGKATEYAQWIREFVEGALGPHFNGARELKKIAKFLERQQSAIDGVSH